MTKKNEIVFLNSPENIFYFSGFSGSSGVCVLLLSKELNCSISGRGFHDLNLVISENQKSCEAMTSILDPQSGSRVKGLGSRMRSVAAQQQNILDPQSSILDPRSSILDFPRSGYFSKTRKKRKIAKIFLLTDFRYRGTAEQNVKSDVKILYYRNFWKKWSNFLKKENVKKVYFENEKISFRLWSRLSKNKDIVLKPAGKILENVRAQKKEDEIQIIKKVCDITDKALWEMKKIVRLGISEKEISFFLQKFFLEKNAKPAFDPIVAIGENSAAPHHKPGDCKLKKGEIILVDLGAKHQNYCSDETRIFSLGGAKEEIENQYYDLLKIQMQCIKKIKLHSEFSTLENFVRKKLSKKEKYFTHSLGHGLGIKIHESPHLSRKNKSLIAENMVFTIEPGVYFPDKFGLRIEDTVLVEKKGASILTHFPKDKIMRV